MAQRPPLRRTIRGGRPFFFDDPAIDKVLNMVVTLAGEVWALRERLAAMEGIGVRQGSLSATEVDDYEFTPEQDQRLAGQRKEFIESLFRVLQEQVDAAAARSGRAAGQAGSRPGVFGARIAAVAPLPARSAARKPSGQGKQGRTGSSVRRPRARRSATGRARR
jgi:hypothetical protein